MAVDDAVVIGLGQIGALFAHGFLRCGRTVVPVTRATRIDDVAGAHPDAALALVAVGEDGLAPVLGAWPAAWRDRIVLTQNELLPADWRAHGIASPTVAVVWLERKRDKPLRVVLPTVVSGPRAPAVADALRALELPVREVLPERLVFELVKKNLYILTSNIAGLEVGGTVGELAADHRDLLGDLAAEILALQAYRVGEPLPGRELIEGLHEAFAADPSHVCRGRTAPMRLSRAVALAREAGLTVPTLFGIAAKTFTSAGG